MTTLNTTYIETLFLSAENLMNEERYPEAKETLLELLTEEPGYGKAHALLGYIYTFYLVNLNEAEKHYGFALKFCEAYPPVISNYALFLLEANKFVELIAFVEANMYSIGADMAFLVALKGNAYEFKRKYRTALRFYKEARAMALNKEFVLNMSNHIERLELKLNRLERMMAAF